MWLSQGMVVFMLTAFCATAGAATTATKLTTATEKTPTTATTTTVATARAALGQNCTDFDASWCESDIRGEVECSQEECACKNGSFEADNVTCVSGNDLTPTNVSINVSTTTASITWSLNTSVGNLDLNFSVLARNTENSSESSYCNVSDSRRAAECSNLTPGYNYSFTVEVSHTPEFKGSLSKYEVLFPAAPGEINKSASNLSSPNVTLKWTASEGRVDVYNVVVKNTTVNRNTTDNRPEIVVAELIAGKTYSIEIVAYSLGKASSKREDTFRTNTTVPGPPQDIQIVNVTHMSVTVKWRETNQSNGDIIRHEICLQQKIYKDEDDYINDTCDNVTRDEGTVYQATGLIAGAFYRFFVYTINDMYKSSTAASIQARTNQTTPGNVTDLKATPGNNSIMLTWQRPSKPNGDIIAYRVDLEWVSDTSRASENCTVYLNSANSSHQNSTCEYSSPLDGVIEVNQEILNLTLTELLPSTKYNISVTAYTEVGAGSTEMVETTTSVAAPGQVSNVTAEVLNSTAVEVSWVVPDQNPGPVNYTVSVIDLILHQPDHQGCTVQGYTSNNCTVGSLEEFWQYRFKVTAYTSAGKRESQSSNNVTTDPVLPGPIQNATVYPYNSLSNCNATKIKFNWTEPGLHNRNYNITEYIFYSADYGYGQVNYTVADPKPYWLENRTFTQDLIGLLPEHNYSFQVYPDSTFGSSNSITVPVIMGACYPPEWEITTLEEIVSSATTEMSVTIRLPKDFFSYTQQGTIKEKGLVIIHTKSDYFEGKPLDSDGLDSIGGWTDAQEKSFKQDYKIQLGQSAFDIDSVEHIDVEIGKNQGCPKSEDATCNGPLPEQFTFKMAAYACTKYSDEKRCTVSSVFGPFSTAAKPTEASSAVWIIPVALLIVLGVVIGAFAYLWIRGIIDPKKWIPGRRGSYEHRLENLDDILRERPISLSRYKNVLEDMHRDTNLKLSDQYEDINKLGEQFKERYPCVAALLESNTPKNRWVNILPFDHTRVKLQQIDDDDPTTDYINANYMPGFSHRREYIATQGPLPGTIDDFWRMVWEHNVSVIVMLTQCKEGNRVKCEKYWPDELREPKQYGEVIVNPISISTLDKYNINIFNATVGSTTRQVIHFHYLDFPDFSADVEYDHFINFVKTVRSHVPRDMTGPMVVHCSAGVGRTGTFILVDRLNQYLNSDKFNSDDEVDIFGLVVELREHRVSMVQTESQYIMIHDCFEKMLEDRKRAIEEEEDLEEETENGEDHPYENQAFDPFPEVLYENVENKRTEL